MLESKDSILNDMRQAQLMHETSRKSIKVNNVDMNLDEIDLNKLQKEQAKDIKEIEDL